MRSLDDYLLIQHTPNGRKYPRLDCWGLIVDIYREHRGIVLDDYTDLTAATMQAGFLAETAGRFYEVNEPQNYDIVAFFTAKRLYHVGIYLDGKILHTSERRNARFEKLNRTPGTNRRFYRYASN
jgi:cell wall-associated NlpC family hydrolase